MGGGTVNILRGARPLQALTVILAVCGTLRLLRHGVWTVPVYAWGFAGYLVVMVPIVAGWYLPPWLAVVVLLTASGCDALSTIAGRHRWIGSALAYGLLLLYAVILPATFQAERGLQTLVETPVRRAAGEWLEENTSPSDWIACECLGYLGYYSNRPMLDFPGLGSPRSVAALRRRPVTERSLQSLIAEETPAWLVLRPGELEQLRARYPEAAALYIVRQRFEADRIPLDQCAGWLGLANSEIFGDREFTILQRTEPSPHDSHDVSRGMD
ncbi:MAG: hypothetical protein B7Z55_04150 [Planctomycetales bacterium 12-60-4]|nr:MAG: hypothetical protein B7Z55_04150 [Planctomycetales bacterium 12-60-4]